LEKELKYNFIIKNALSMGMRKIAIVFFMLSSVFTYSQTGGSNSFAFLNLPFSARSMALGGDLITIKDKDQNLAILNPALLNESMHNSISTNQALLPAGINYGMFNYARTFKNELTGMGHIRYVDYGKMVRRDEIGNDLGIFKPMDIILGASVGKAFAPKWNVGMTFNLIYSQLEIYNSFGASIDFGVSYYNEEKLFGAAFIAKNAGFQFNGYSESNRDPLPAELQASVSKKLRYAPFRFSLLAHHLNRFDLSYNDPSAKPTIDALTGDTIPPATAGFVEKVAQHFTYQIEILLSDNFHIRTAFDYLKRQEMKLASRPGLSGFSFGVGMSFKRFTIDYGALIQSRAGSQHMISLSSNLDKWRK
jgi:hypothetical protein